MHILPDDIFYLVYNRSEECSTDRNHVIHMVLLNLLSSARFRHPLAAIIPDLPEYQECQGELLKVLYPVTEVPEKNAGKKKNTKAVDMPAKLFDEIAPKYADRKGGYTRIIKIGQRKGDAAMEVVIELV